MFENLKSKINYHHKPMTKANLENNHQTPHNSQKGSEGEDMATEVYLADGFEIVARNFQFYTKGRQGRIAELDLIASKEDLLVIVEVKNRANQKYGTAIEQVSMSKLKSIYLCTRYFLQTNPRYYSYKLRFDVVYIDGGELKILKNAFNFDNFG